MRLDQDNWLTQENLLILRSVKLITPAKSLLPCKFPIITPLPTLINRDFCLSVHPPNPITPFTIDILWVYITLLGNRHLPKIELQPHHLTLPGPRVPGNPTLLSSDHPPLQHAGVLAPCGQGHAVIPQEGHVCHMAAVSTVFVAEGL